MVNNSRPAALFPFSSDGVFFSAAGACLLCDAIIIDRTKPGYITI
jgi:hypothetical protein